MESMRSRSDDDFIAPERTLRLPDDLRDELKNPLGEVVDEDQLESILKDVDKIVSVGDQCSLTLYGRGITPDITIVDFKVQRGDIHNMREKIQEIGQIVINVDNPPGAITRELWQAVEEAYQKEEKVRIEVSGEEDLATLPSIWFAPKNTAILYGLPHKGIVVVLDIHEAKMKVKDVLTKMK